MNITFVTSNPNKLREAQAILGMPVSSQTLEIPEYQSFNLEEIVRAKAAYAFRALKKPVLVEDVSFHIGVLGGFPGPFVKFWEKESGYDRVVEMVRVFGDNRAVAKCGVGYVDADRVLYAEGMVTGTLVSRRGGDGWGFDFYFQPDGFKQTYSELGPEQKNLISHRRRGLDAMRKKLGENGLG